MKNLKEKIKSNKSGITLIALVITIIVLLILAGVSIAMLTGQNGILTQAQNAKNRTELSSEKEQIELAAQASITKNPDTLEITKTNLDEGIQEQLGNNREFETTDNQDGSFIVNLKNPDRMYYVDETGKVIPEENMLKISTADELKTFRDDVNSGNTYEGWYVYLANDITLDINEEWEAIGNKEYPFKGIFSGEKHEITGIYINTTEENQALFGYSDKATFSNLGIGQNCSITGGNFTAGIIGTAYNKTQIINCFNKSSITCYGIASGGIAGQLSVNGLIRKCYNTGNISSSGTHIGGICGNVDKNSVIEECYNSSIITGSSKYVGGILGVLQNGCILQNSYNTGKISGNISVGGICGEAMGSEAYVKNSYNVGSITGNIQVSGIVYCWNNSNAINCFYLENTVNSDNDTILNEGITPMSSEMIKQSINLLGNSFKEDTNNINNGYPILNWQ